MKRTYLVVLMAMALDAVGIGLIMPVLPGLLRTVGHVDDIGWIFGAFLSAYAAMQVLFSPLLGALSDRYGRRPVLLVSLAGSMADYLFMAFAPSLPLLFVGRLISGITGASMAVASAYMADISSQDRRARGFGHLSASFGVGFIAGPALGGVLGDIWLRAPFLAAAVLTGTNLALAFFLLPEPKRAHEGREKPSLNPLAPLRWALTFPALLSLLGAFAVLALVGEVGGTIWVLYVQDKFGWDLFTVGISLALFGVFHAGAQGFVAGPIAERWGEKRALIIAILADGAAYVSIALAWQGWMVFPLLPLFCLGGIGAPALQSLLTSRVGADHQGRLQGVLTSMTSLVSVFGPFVIATLYFRTRAVFPGTVWIAGAALYVVCLPLLLRAGPSPALREAAE
ncbi:Tet(A)/Tet(B)/Tet(C) family tetracycline efflux MFS transporter [Mesorhizobium sp. B2-3-4]|uniref:Tet(A)/Tet(B)/Tet(C) family tetracycline efflux MFS transporter n=1 Tax=Mesorhizobium sp. B2-3-4 TaxID=2589959 RepID=UPI001129085A|nr:Tet(A)/Tet(B)/Tet(C) family tetracycline efflux MFS transporter [Mesorhizobium sp. B2-3-4]TPM41366.1 Tet(A)/Tet(B)/Tet(C) family tetracycline efflux MFS transporter [Mesorhizobium sp. B2-3-4]